MSCSTLAVLYDSPNTRCGRSSSRYRTEAVTVRYHLTERQDPCGVWAASFDSAGPEGTMPANEPGTGSGWTCP
ncbi:hypothetical protein ABH940_006888 [Streptacidiphilus sp. BW17]